MTENPYRDLPSVDVLAERIDSPLPRRLVVEAARRALDLSREEISAGRIPDPVRLADEIAGDMRRRAGIRVVNATGVLLHTNLGRASWSEMAIAAASAAARHQGNLEIDLQTGERGRRGEHIATQMHELIGAEDTLVVNNNAAATMLALAALAGGRSVPVSRGELIEIGGSFRLPAVMEGSGAKMVEVGTTNRTRLGDFQTALQLHDCAAVLKVHPSNYRVVGFTEETSLEELAALCRSHGIPLLHDIGSGLLDEKASWLPGWLRGEPGARQSLEEGASIVSFSGDKLLGGPQAGIIAGDRDTVSLIRSHPLARALRVDAVTYAALGATLGHYLEDSPTQIPFWRQALTEDSVLEARCATLAAGLGATVEPGRSAVGAGSAPGMEIPTPVLRIPGGQGLFECLLRANDPIVTRRDSGDLIIDLRAVDPVDDALILDAVARCR